METQKTFRVDLTSFPLLLLGYIHRILPKLQLHTTMEVVWPEEVEISVFLLVSQCLNNLSVSISVTRISIYQYIMSLFPKYSMVTGQWWVPTIQYSWIPSCGISVPWIKPCTRHISKTSIVIEESKANDMCFPCDIQLYGWNIFRLYSGLC